MGMSGYLCEKNRDPKCLRNSTMFDFGGCEILSSTMDRSLYFYKPHSGNQSQSQQHCKTICLVESWWCDVIGVTKTHPMFALFQHFLVKYDTLWKMLVQSLLKEFLDHLTQQIESFWLDESSWKASHSCEPMNSRFSTWDHEDLYSNWTLCHPRIETRRIHVVGCWVKLCHRDGWISVGWFQSSYLLGGIKIKDFKQGLVFPSKSAIVIQLYIYKYRDIHIWFI